MIKCDSQICTKEMQNNKGYKPIEIHIANHNVKISI